MLAKKKVLENLKFEINKRVGCLAFFVFVLCIFFYFACLAIKFFLENDQELPFGNPDRMFFFISIFCDVLLAVLSVLCASIAGSFLIEVRSKNRLHKEILADEILTATDYYDHMPVERKREICKHIEASTLFNGNENLSDISETVKNKIIELKKDQYFFSSYSAIMTCNVQDDKFVRKVSKTMYLNSYKEKYKLKGLELAKNIYNNDNGNSGIRRETFVLKINDIKRNDFEVIKGDVEDDIARKSGYTKKTVYKLKKPLKLSSNTWTKVEIEYEVVVDRKDTLFVVRLPVASKFTEFQFGLTSENGEHKALKIVSQAFGFVNDASSTHNSSMDPEYINMKFTEWVFPQDGWVVEIQEKK